MKFVQAVEGIFSDFKTLALGSLFSIIPVVNFTAAGYALKCANPKNKKPELSVDTWVFGLKSLLITILYGLVFSGIVLALFGAVIFRNLDDLWTAVLDSLPMVIPASIFGLLLLPMMVFSLLAFAKTGSLSEGFSIGKILKNAYKPSNLWLMLKGLFGSGIIAAAVGLVPVIGWAVGGFVSQVAFWTYLGSNAE